MDNFVASDLSVSLVDSKVRHNVLALDLFGAVVGGKPVNPFMDID